MKAFLLKVGLFLLPLFIIGIFLEYTLQNITNDYSYKNDYLEKNAKDLEVLFLGNSHSYYGINPEFISKKSFNASHVSQSLAYDFEIFKKFNPKLTKLKILAIPISYFSLHYNVENGKEAWREKNYCIYYNIFRSKQIKNYFELTSNSAKTDSIILTDYYKKNKDLKKCNALGWRLHDSLLYRKNMAKNAKRSAKRHNYSVAKNLKQNQSILKDFIAIAKSKNFKILLYTAPVTEKYYTLLNPKKLRENKKVMASLTDNKTVFYHDFINDARFQESDFYDADHLNNQGAAKFSKIMDATLLTVVATIP